MYAIIRLRGDVNASPDIKYTLELLRLHRVNHCVVAEDNEYSRGMIRKVKDYVAWGEISEEILESLLRNRGRITGGQRLSEELIRDKTSVSTFSELAHALTSSQITMKELAAQGIKPVFRLHPPRKGHSGIKRSYTQGGVLGYHGEKINDLLIKMR
ncbi:MAG TPA: 50S ribosomal protein L30 [Methanomicrobia archaeon]|nr:50S ribosomal protein L30 [Methanomicrobia archaeon]